MKRIMNTLSYLGVLLFAAFTACSPSTPETVNCTVAQLRENPQRMRCSFDGYFGAEDMLWFSDYEAPAKDFYGTYKATDRLSILTAAPSPILHGLRCVNSLVHAEFEVELFGSNIAYVGDIYEIRSAESGELCYFPLGIDVPPER